MKIVLIIFSIFLGILFILLLLLACPDTLFTNRRDRRAGKKIAKEIKEILKDERN